MGRPSGLLGAMGERPRSPGPPRGCGGAGRVAAFGSVPPPRSRQAQKGWRVWLWAQDGTQGGEWTPRPCLWVCGHQESRRWRKNCQYLKQVPGPEPVPPEVRAGPVPPGGEGGAVPLEVRTRVGPEPIPPRRDGAEGARIVVPDPREKRQCGWRPGRAQGSGVGSLGEAAPLVESSAHREWTPLGPGLGLPCRRALGCRDELWAPVLAVSELRGGGGPGWSCGALV